jgi:hypothetical protein
MPKHPELRTVPLWCADCEEESPEKAVFMGEAWYTVHTVGPSDVPTNVTFDRAVSPCPNNPTHRRIGDAAEAEFSEVRIRWPSTALSMRQG